MISFELPPFIENQPQLIEMVAQQAMRPYSRELDENEHEPPDAFVNMTWPFTQQMVKRTLKSLEKAADSNGSNGHSAQAAHGARLLYLGLDHDDRAAELGRRRPISCACRIRCWAARRLTRRARRSSACVS